MSALLKLSFILKCPLFGQLMVLRQGGFVSFNVIKKNKNLSTYMVSQIHVDKPL